MKLQDKSQTKTSPETYDEEYFENGIKTGRSGYENYRWLPKRTWREARAIIYQLELEPKEYVLDFGCSKGFMVKALRDYGIEAYGTDISDYAIANCHKDVKEFVAKDALVNKVKAVISRNTFEHIEADKLGSYLREFQKITDTIFFTVPLKKDGFNEYVIPIANKDETHKLIWTLDQWIEFCKVNGWYDVRTSFHLEGMHYGWENYSAGIGYITLRK